MFNKSLAGSIKQVADVGKKTGLYFEAWSEMTPLTSSCDLFKHTKRQLLQNLHKKKMIQQPQPMRRTVAIFESEKSFPFFVTSLIFLAIIFFYGVWLSYIAVATSRKSGHNY